MSSSEKKVSRDLTKGPLAKQILVFSIPLVLSDIAVVGQFAGSHALGSVGSTTTLVTLFTTFLIGVSGGVNVMTAQYIGAKKNKDVREVVHSAAWMCALMGVILLLFGLVFSRLILEVMKTKEELIDGAALYLRIYFLGMPALGIYNFGNAVFSAIGDTKKPVYILAISGVVNILLNLFFVIVCKLSVAGVAIASVTSQYMSAVLIMVALMRADERIRFSSKYLKFYPDKVKDLFKLGFPAGIQNAIFQFANLFVQVGVNSFDAVIVEGNSAATNAVYDVMAAFYTACASFMGQNYGARNKKRVRNSYIISLAYSFGIGMVMGITLNIFGRPFLSLFTKDSAVIDAGMLRLNIMSISYGFSAFMDCTIAASHSR